MTTGIYKLTWTDGAVYIGQAVNIEARYKTHCSNMRSGKHTAKVQNHFNFCGLPELEVVVVCHRDYLDHLESIWISHYSDHHILNTSIPKLPDDWRSFVDQPKALTHSMGALISHICDCESEVLRLAREMTELENTGVVLPVELARYRADVEVVRSWNKRGLWDRLCSAWTGNLG